MTQGGVIQLLWLVWLTALMNAYSADAAMPDPVTEQACRDCEWMLKWLETELKTCEEAILASQQAAGGKVTGFKNYFADVENQMAKIEPGIKALDKELDEKYKQEAAQYKELSKESRAYSASFLNRRGSQSPAELLTDRWLKCDDEQKAAGVYLNGCKTKAKTVTMWNDQRVRQYKNKADVYIMRQSRMADPLNTQFKESARVSASIDRMERQVEPLKNEKLELVCPLTCQFPACAFGEPGNGGEDLVGKTVWGSMGCTHYCSRPFTDQGTRFCGKGEVYTAGAYIDCTQCAPGLT